MKQILVSGSFDNLRSPHVRFLHEASRLGKVHLLLWSDAVVRAVEQKEPAFPQEERLYFLDSIRYIDRVTLVNDLPDPHVLPAGAADSSAVWAVLEDNASDKKQAFCQANGIDYHLIQLGPVSGLPH
jgi:glycerol-3-phosphate cytidylyltransferase-like family protein